MDQSTPGARPLSPPARWAFLLVGLAIALVAVGLLVILLPAIGDAFTIGAPQGTALVLETVRATSEIVLGLLVVAAALASTWWSAWGRLRIAGVVLGLGLVSAAIEALILALSEGAAPGGIGTAALVGVPGALIIAAAVHAREGAAGLRAGAVAAVAASFLFFTLSFSGRGSYTIESGAYSVQVQRAAFSAYEALFETRLVAVAVVLAAAALLVAARRTDASARVARGLSGGAALALSTSLVLVGIGAIATEIWNDEGLALGARSEVATWFVIVGIFVGAVGGVAGLVGGARALEEAVAH